MIPRLKVDHIFFGQVSEHNGSVSSEHRQVAHDVAHDFAVLIPLTSFTE